eukprot:120776-Prymnesium_polylepis.2
MNVSLRVELLVDLQRRHFQQPGEAVFVHPLLSVELEIEVEGAHGEGHGCSLATVHGGAHASSVCHGFGYDAGLGLEPRASSTPLALGLPQNEQMHPNQRCWPLRAQSPQPAFHRARAAYHQTTSRILLRRVAPEMGVNKRNASWVSVFAARRLWVSPHERQLGAGCVCVLTHRGTVPAGR